MVIEFRSVYITLGFPLVGIRNVIYIFFRYLLKIFKHKFRLFRGVCAILVGLYFHFLKSCNVYIFAKGTRTKSQVANAFQLNLFFFSVKFESA